MTDAELIARQAKQIEELLDEVTDLKARVERSINFVYAIGGPLNDNCRQYNREQMFEWRRLVNHLEGGK